MEIHYHSHGSIRDHSSRTSSRRCRSWDIGTTHSSSIVHANGTWKRKLRNSPGTHTQWLGSAHHPRATEHCSMQGQSPSLFTSFALWGQDKLILLYSTLCFLSHEYFLLLAQEISLTEFLNKKPIKWDHWKKKKRRFCKRGNEHAQEQRILLPPIPICPIRMSGGSLWKDRHSFQLIIRLLKNVIIQIQWVLRIYYWTMCRKVIPRVNFKERQEQPSHDSCWMNRSYLKYLILKDCFSEL